MPAYPEPTMPRSTDHLAERVARLNEPGASQPPSAERVAAITRSLRHIANHVRALRAASTLPPRSVARCANCRGAAMCERWCPEFVPE